MKVWVKNIKGDHIIVELDQKDNAKIIAYKIATSATIPKGTHFCLYYNSQAIEPNKDTVSSLEIEEYDVITILGEKNVYVPFQINSQNHPLLQIKNQSQISGGDSRVKSKVSQSSSTSNFKVDASLVHSLSLLGYGKEQSRQALIETRGDTGKAIQLLKSKSKRSQQSGQGQTNIFQQMISSLSRMNNQRSSLSREDKQNINLMIQLCENKVSRQQAQQAYLLNNKNVQEALQSLFQFLESNG